jgi:ribonuclease P protein component
VKKRFRLRRRADFQRAMAAGRVFAGPTIVAFASPKPPPGRSGPRIGVTVSRRLPSAVVRNRARRRVREAVRLELQTEDSALLAGGITVDVVLIARPPALTIDFQQLRREVRRAAARVAGRVRSA